MAVGAEAGRNSDPAGEADACSGAAGGRDAEAEAAPEACGGDGGDGARLPLLLGGWESGDGEGWLGTDLACSCTQQLASGCAAAAASSEQLHLVVFPLAVANGKPGICQACAPA